MNGKKIDKIIMTFMIFSVFILLCGMVAYKINAIYFDWYINTSYVSIIEYCTKPEVKASLGIIPVRFGDENILLSTSFYETVILDRKIIQYFLHNISWEEIISNNNHNISDIHREIIEKYIIYVDIIERSHIKYLTQPYNIVNAKQQAMYYILTISRNDNIKAYSCTPQEFVFFVRQIVDIIDWDYYIRTDDFQSQKYFMLEYHLEQQIQAFLDDTKKEYEDDVDHESNIFTFVRLFSNIAAGYVISTLLFMIRLKLYNIPFEDYVFNKAMIIVKENLIAYHFYIGKPGDYLLTGIEEEDFYKRFAATLILRYGIQAILGYPLDNDTIV